MCRSFVDFFLYKKAFFDFPGGARVPVPEPHQLGLEYEATRGSIPRLGSRTRSVDYEKMEMMNRNIRRSRDPSISNLTNRLVNSIDSFKFEETNCKTMEMSLALMSQNYIEVTIHFPDNFT